MKAIFLAILFWGRALAANSDINDRLGTTILTLDFILAIGVIFALFCVSIYATIVKSQQQSLYAKYTVSHLLR